MRTKPCWSDSFPLPILWPLIVTIFALGFLLVSECQPKEAHAGAYLDVAGGMTQFLITAPDGDYLQRGLPRTLDTLSLATYKVGLGYRFNPRWSVSIARVSFGTLNQTAKFVSDADYDPKAHRCLANCAGAPTYRITDAYHGGELTVTRTFHLDESWAWHLKAGGAYLMHRFTINREDGTGQSNQHYGQFLSTVAGAGASYKWAYLEADYYHGLGGSNGFMGHDQGWPLSKEQVVAWAGIKIPLTN